MASSVLYNSGGDFSSITAAIVACPRLVGSLAQACPPPIEIDQAPAPWPAPPSLDITVCGWSNGDVNAASCNYVGSCLGDCTHVTCLAEAHDVQITGSVDSPVVIFDTGDSVGYMQVVVRNT